MFKFNYYIIRPPKNSGTLKTCLVLKERTVSHVSKADFTKVVHFLLYINILGFFFFKPRRLWPLAYNF